jgi:alpha-methylacyl-CoA racemase
MYRNRPSVAVDLKHHDAAQLVLRLVEPADVLIEGFRPGVAERLGIGPEQCHAVNRGLVYGRITGWGQDGPYAGAPGHDINYIAVTGVLKSIGRACGKPAPPLNLLGDFGGGGMLLIVGVLAALFESRRSGLGQVVDAAMVDGAALLTTYIMSLIAHGGWEEGLERNVLDGANPFYDLYPTSDGQYVAIGALEPRFRAALLDRLGLPNEFPDDIDRKDWSRIRERLTAVFRARTREEWSALAGDTQLSLSPVHSFTEAPANPHNRGRGTYVEVDGIAQPAPAPRFSRTPAATPTAAPLPGANAMDALGAWGLDTEEIAGLVRARVVHTRDHDS